MSKFKIMAQKESASEPVISKAIFKTGAQFYIMNARVGDWGKELVVEIIGSDEQIEEAINNLEKGGARVAKYEEKVTFDRELCVDCGACVTLCPWFAIDILEDWAVKHNKQKCVAGCSLCLKSCPVNAIKIEETLE